MNPRDNHSVFVIPIKLEDCLIPNLPSPPPNIHSFGFLVWEQFSQIGKQFPDKLILPLYLYEEKTQLAK